MKGIDDELREIKQAFGDLMASLSPPSGPSCRSDNNNNFNINAGGVGLWVAVTACLVMLAAFAVAVPVATGAYLATQDEMRADRAAAEANFKELRDKDETLQAYISVINPQEKEEKK
jgi:hypothetical protein